jgi:hypothetical protein
MKTSNQFQTFRIFLIACFFMAGFNSCQKDLKQTNQPEDLQQNANINSPDNSENGHLKQTKTFSSDVAVKWLYMQLNMLRVPLAPGTATEAAERCMAYCGIALYESVVRGMPAYESLGGQLNQLPQMPATQHGKAYHWAACANAALAYMNRHLFPNTSAANNVSIDSLENALQVQYAGDVDAATLQRSIDFGRAVSAAVFTWAQADGTASMPPPSSYIIPVGPGLWEKTPPNFAGPVNPFLSMRRQMVAGSRNGATPAPPPAYSTDPSSDFYAMVKNVYDKSLVLTPDQTAAAIYHRDAPGYPGGGTLPAMVAQVIQKSQCKLDIAALAYVKTGIASYEALTFCFILKYTHNLVRPITYIRNVMGHSAWLALFNTPGHPEFPAAHATQGGIVSAMLTNVFGGNFAFTLNHYNYLGLPARNYQSFDQLGREMANSRVFAGIHYQPSVDKGFVMGKKIANNILKKIEFKDDEE